MKKKKKKYNKNNGYVPHYVNEYENLPEHNLFIQNEVVFRNGNIRWKKKVCTFFYSFLTYKLENDLFGVSKNLICCAFFVLYPKKGKIILFDE